MLKEIVVDPRLFISISSTSFKLKLSREAGEAEGIFWTLKMKFTGKEGVRKIAEPKKKGGGVKRSTFLYFSLFAIFLQRVPTCLRNGTPQQLPSFVYSIRRVPCAYEIVLASEFAGRIAGSGSRSPWKDSIPQGSSLEFPIWKLSEGLCPKSYRVSVSLCFIAACN